MTEYLISQELRDALIGLILLLQMNSERIYHKHSGRSSYRIITDTGEEIKLPFLFDMKKELEDLEELIEESEYDSKVEEVLYVARELKML